MPDAGDAHTRAAPPNTPNATADSGLDLVGQELSDDAHIWRVYDHVARVDDDRRISTWNRGLDNLALFAGLFSAVTTAFIIEAQNDMKPDYSQLTFQVVNASAFNQQFIAEPFVVPSSARVVNCLWITSLVLSLSAALIAIMGKDWIGTYASRPVCNLRQWAEMRTYRLRCVERWYMSGVIATAPVLLHISLLLFGAGLVMFISSDSLTHQITFALCLVVGGSYIAMALTAVLFTTSPFQSPATQMLRSALSTLLVYLRNDWRPKRRPLRTLLRAIHVIVLPHRGQSPPLDGRFFPGSLQRRNRQTARAILMQLRGSLLALICPIPAFLRTSIGNLKWTHLKPQLASAVTAARTLQLPSWLTPSIWTDVPIEQTPSLVAESLSWLSNASQAPDVFRSLLSALGDLEIGSQVAPRISADLRGRLREEIDRPRQFEDFLTLSHYARASRNLHNQVPSALFPSFCCIAEENTSLHCESGLAAALILGSAPDQLVKLFPDQLVQKRLPELLLPYVTSIETLLVLVNRYRDHLWRVSGFDLEAELRKQPDFTFADYPSVVTNAFGARPGAIELLTFLFYNHYMRDLGKNALIDLVLHLLVVENPRQHRCLAHLFGHKVHRFDIRETGNMSDLHLRGLIVSLEDSLRSAELYNEGQVFALSNHQRIFTIKLARTVVRVLSCRHEYFGRENVCIDFLYALLCSPRVLLGEAEELDIIHLILEEAALYRIAGGPFHHGTGVRGVSILATITGRICTLLSRPETRLTGELFFASLAFTEVRCMPDNRVIGTWDLGGWIRHFHLPSLIELEDHLATTPLKDFHDALASIHEMCPSSTVLQDSWDRIGYHPKYPSDIFSDPFLDIGTFFELAEGDGSTTSVVLPGLSRMAPWARAPWARDPLGFPPNSDSTRVYFPQSTEVLQATFISGVPPRARS